MKIISFSAVEILPALLDKRKTQTIRPAWYEIEDKNVLKKISLEKQFPTLDRIEQLKEKQPRFKVGEKVRLVWKQRSQHRWFCNNCGDSLSRGYYLPEEIKCCFKCGNYEDFNAIPKTLGTGTISEVFKIRMSIDAVYSDTFKFAGISPESKAYEDLAKQDGFEDAKSMFKWFDEHYSLVPPKEFIVYRWRWN